MIKYKDYVKESNAKYKYMEQLFQHPKYGGSRNDILKILELYKKSLRKIWLKQLS